MCFPHLSSFSFFCCFSFLKKISSSHLKPPSKILLVIRDYFTWCHVRWWWSSLFYSLRDDTTWSNFKNKMRWAIKWGSPSHQLKFAWGLNLKSFWERKKDKDSLFSLVVFWYISCGVIRRSEGNIRHLFSSLCDIKRFILSIMRGGERDISSSYHLVLNSSLWWWWKSVIWNVHR